MKKIAVVGSLNTDLVILSEKMPLKGETILGEKFFFNAGGKGANQAVAASRLGGNVTFFGCVGADHFGEELIANLEKENIIPNVEIVKDNTGLALVNLYEGDNSIIVVPGANHFSSKGYIKRLKEELLAYDIILFQLETNQALIEELIPYLHKKNKMTILNPAPAIPLNEELLNAVTYLTPNEHECQIIYQTDKSLGNLVEENNGKLLVTCGSEGVLYYQEGLKREMPIRVKNVVDTTGAGDTFSGAFTFALSENKSMEEAVKFANIAAGLSIQKMGAQTGMPTIKMIVDYKGSVAE